MPNKNTIQIALRWCLSYYLTAQCELSSVFHHTSVSPSCDAGCLLPFLVSADLVFPQSPSARSTQRLSERSPIRLIEYRVWQEILALRKIFSTHTFLAWNSDSLTPARNLVSMQAVFRSDEIFLPTFHSLDIR